MTVCILDTSVLLNLLKVPGRSQQHTETLKEFNRLTTFESDVNLLLPFASILETGNHIAQLGDGRQRRSYATAFVVLVRKTLADDAPWVFTPMPSVDRIGACLDGFPDCAIRQIGFADRTIIEEWERQRVLWPKRRVLIWSFDQHLASYDTHPSR